jgi:hypothetical protein
MACQIPILNQGLGSQFSIQCMRDNEGLLWLVPAELSIQEKARALHILGRPAFLPVELVLPPVALFCSTMMVLKSYCGGTGVNNVSSIIAHNITSSRK